MVFQPLSFLLTHCTQCYSSTLNLSMMPNSFHSSETANAMRNLPQDFLNLPADSEIWESLKQAIAASSGFQRWQLEQNNNETPANSSLDYSIRRYLRETLETLAY